MSRPKRWLDSSYISWMSTTRSCASTLHMASFTIATSVGLGQTGAEIAETHR